MPKVGTAKQRGSAKASAVAKRSLPEKTFVLDNGSYTLKAGYAPDSASSDDEGRALSSCAVVPNAVAKTRGNRVFLGSQLQTHVTDWNEVMFRRPMEKGYIVNWEAQRAIWENSFFDEKTVRSSSLLIANPQETTLVLTEAPNALPALQRNADEIVMEEWGFGGYLRSIGMTLFSLSLSLSPCHDR